MPTLTFSEEQQIFPYENPVLLTYAFENGVRSRIGAKFFSQRRCLRLSLALSDEVQAVREGAEGAPRRDGRAPQEGHRKVLPGSKGGRREDRRHYRRQDDQRGGEEQEGRGDPEDVPGIRPQGARKYPITVVLPV